jgi:tetratricopeptide (TPR) repeat protein
MVSSSVLRALPRPAGDAGRAPLLAAKFRRVLPLIAAVALGCGGPPRVVRVPVPPADIVRANRVSQEGDVAFARKDYYSALIKYLEGGRTNPNSEFIHNKLGITYSQLGYHRDAIDAFRRSIGINQRYPYSHNNLGSVYFAIGDKRRAERCFKKAISLDPNVASFHVNLGSLYFEKGRFDRGLAEWRKAVSLDPTILRRTEGVSLVAAGSRSSRSDRSYFMARLFAAAGDAARAVASLEEALKLGFSDLESVRRERDFDPIRDDPRFRDLMNTRPRPTR